MTTERSRFNVRQRQRIYSSKQRQEQIRGPPTLISWTRLRGGQARQPPEPLTYKGRYDVFEIIGNMVSVNLDFVVKEFLRNYPQLGHVSSKSFTQPIYLWSALLLSSGYRRFFLVAKHMKGEANCSPTSIDGGEN
jgi:hypothetical protein